MIWSSWIEKYSDYINPDYRKFSNTEDDNTPKNIEKKNFTFDRISSMDTIDNNGCGSTFTASATTNQQPPNNSETEIFVSSCSPAANSNEMVEDGWNPLPSTSNDDTWNTHRMPVSSQDIENLLSPRCESVTSSIPLTIGTTDSMTNVTHMTVSSYDFGGSSRVTSESSELTPSSPDNDSSSISLSSQLLMELGDDAKLALLGEDDAMDSDQHWHILWQKNFQEQYAKEYKKFSNSQRKAYTNLSLSFHADSATAINDNNLFNENDDGDGGGSVDDGQLSLKARLTKRKKNHRKLTTEYLPKLVNNLNLQSSALKNDENMPSIINPKSMLIDLDKNEINESESMAMASMGLPLSFGKRAHAMKRR